MKNLPNVARLYESHTDSALPLGTAASRQSNSITEKGLEKNSCRPYITDLLLQIERCRVHQ